MSNTSIENASTVAAPVDQCGATRVIAIEVPTDILSPAAYPWRYYVTASRPKNHGCREYTFVSPQARGSAIQTLACFGYHELGPTEYPYSEEMTCGEAEMVADWLKWNEGFKDIKVHEIDQSDVANGVGCVLPKLIEFSDGYLTGHVFDKSNGWFGGFPVFAVSKWEPARPDPPTSEPPTQSESEVGCVAPEGDNQPGPVCPPWLEKKEVC